MLWMGWWRKVHRRVRWRVQLFYISDVVVTNGGDGVAVASSGCGRAIVVVVCGLLRCPVVCAFGSLCAPRPARNGHGFVKK